MTTNNTSNRNRYGVSARTIRYFQKQGSDLQRMTGWMPRQSVLTTAAVFDRLSGRQITELLLMASALRHFDMAAWLNENQ
jgi:hypothetical protein